MSHVATPADSAGGSNAATADDGHGANPIAANPVAAAALAGPGGAAAPHHAHPPPFASNPPPAHALLHDADGQVWMTANATSTQGAAQPHPLATPQPAHSMQNSVFTARRWAERATGSTSTVGRGGHSAGEGGVDEEDSAGDSNTAAVSEGTTAGPADSTQAQHVKSGGGSPSRSVGGEEVEGGGSRDTAGGGGSLRGGTEAVDSHPGFGMTVGGGGIGDGFAEGGGVTGVTGVTAAALGPGEVPVGAPFASFGGLTGEFGLKNETMSFAPGAGGAAAGGSRRADRRGVRGGGRRGGGGGGGGRSSSGMGAASDVPPVAGWAGGQVQSGARGGGSFGRGPKPAGSALKGGSVLPPVPLFNAAPPHVRGIDSPVPPGTAAAARAAQTQEAEGECDGLATTNPGLGGMDIGDGDGGPMGYVVPAHSEEHGYAPALASGDMTYSGDGGYVSGGGTSGPASIGGGGNSGPNSGAPSSGGLGSGGLGSGGLGSGGAVVGTASGALFDSNRLDSGGNRPGGGFEFGGAANVPAVAAASGARAADASPSLGGGGDPFSGPDGSGRGFSGGVDARGAAKSHFSNGGAASDGFVYRDTTAGGGNQTLQGQHRAVSGSLGHVSMHKNGPTAAARAVVEDGGDESEEDGEEGVSPAFVPEDSAAGEESPADVDM